MAQTYTPTAKATSGLAVSFTLDPSSTSGACSLSAGTFTFTGAGNCIDRASQGGSSTYAPAPVVKQTVTVHAVAQVTASLSVPSTITTVSHSLTPSPFPTPYRGDGQRAEQHPVPAVGGHPVSASGSPSSQSAAGVQWSPVSIAAGSFVTYSVVVKVTAASGTLNASVWSYPVSTGSIQPNAALSYAAASTKIQ